MPLDDAIQMAQDRVSAASHNAAVACAELKASIEHLQQLQGQQRQRQQNHVHRPLGDQLQPLPHSPQRNVQRQLSHDTVIHVSANTPSSLGQVVQQVLPQRQDKHNARARDVKGSEVHAHS